MAKKTTPSFILELPVKVSPQDERELDVRLNAARQLYNACLGEALRRLALAHQSRLWTKARKATDKKDRAKAFRWARQAVDFDEYALHRFVVQTKNACWIGDHLDVHVCQKIATRAFQAVDSYAFGKRGKPRFKSVGRLRSVEGKNNEAGIRWREGVVVWGGLKLPALLDPKDRHGWQRQSLERRVKYVRLVRKPLRGRQCWYAQLVLEGPSPHKAKNVIGQGVVGLDIGPSSIAAVGEAEAFLAAFCAEVEEIWESKRRIQRLLDRSRRKTNPDLFERNGTVKPGRHRWNKSQRYVRLRAELAEQERKLAAARKRSQGELANRILALGKDIKTEKLSYRAFQRLWGKAVGSRAPGMFMVMLRRKAESAGGRVQEFSTRTTRLSQACHCGTTTKKALSERWHRCACGVGPVQRDLYSAFLARHVNNEQLDTSRAATAWASAESLLGCAVSRAHQHAKGRHRLASFGFGRRQSVSHIKGGLDNQAVFAKAGDVVGAAPAAAESFGEASRLSSH